MLDKQIVFTYGELIDAFNTWNSVLERNEVPATPIGNNAGEMFTNYLIDTVNKARQQRLTTYGK